MNNLLLSKLKEANFIPFEIENLSMEDLLNENTFDYLLTIDNETKRLDIINKLKMRAKKLECLPKLQKKLAFLDINTDKSEKLSHNEVADKLLDENNIVIYDNRLYIYENGVYTEDKKIVEKKIINIIPKANSFFRNEVYKNLELKATNKIFDKESEIINFKNGLYNLKSKQLYAHTPEFFSMNQVDVNYIANPQKIIAVDDFLDKISSYKKERKNAILEMIGYSMTTSVKLQKAFILYGETARNGKSTLSNVIQALIGKDNVSNISLKDMARNAFATFQIRNKLLNIGSEMSDEFLEDMSTFKMFVTGDYLSVEEKFKSKQTISPYAKMLFIANELPAVADKTNGFYRRLEIIPLETSFTDEDAKSFNIKDLLTSEALEYLANISVSAYLNMGNVFSNYEESDREVKKYKLNANSVVSFFNDKDSNCLYRKAEVTAQEFYSAYKDYCIANQYKGLGRNKFYEQLEKNNYVKVFSKNNQKYYSFK